jgi:hypothetical protein
MGERAKWSRRGGDDLPRCGVTGCDALAVASLRADSTGPRAWLVDLDDSSADEGSNENVCARHANALVASTDWTVHDERRQRTRAERSIDSSRRTRSGPAATETLPEVDLRRATSPPGVDGFLDPRSPLLSRAFAKSRR